MPPIPGTVVGGAIVPTDTADTYPVTDPQWGLGGAQFKTTTAARNAISVQRLQKGMLVFVEADGNTYRLKNTWAGGVTTDADWEVAVGASGAFTGNAGSIPYWQTSTLLVSNIFFTRDLVSGVVTNTPGFFVDNNVTANRFISPTGDNVANTGLSALSPWQTPAYALSRCMLAGPGNYVINCAAGNYLSVSTDVPQMISRGADTSGFQYSIIQFLGDTGTPSNVVFSHNSTMFYHYASNVHLKMSGIRLEGTGSVTPFVQGAGSLSFNNCEGDGFFQFVSASNGASVIVDGPTVLTDTTYGISGTNVQVRVSDGFVQTSPNPISSPPTMFLLTNSSLVFGTGADCILNSEPASQSGFLFNLSNCFVNFGNFNSYEANDVQSFWSCSNGTRLVTSQPNTFQVNNSASIFELSSDSSFIDAANTWLVNAIPAGGIRLSTGAFFISNVILQRSIFFEDYLYAYVQYPADPEFVSRADDNRFTEKYFFTTLGEIPQGYTANEIGPNGVLSDPYYIFEANHACEIIQAYAYNEIPSGPGTTDTYTVAVNNVASALAVPLANVSSNRVSVTVPLAIGDRVSFKFTSDAATVAENVTLGVVIRLVR